MKGELIWLISQKDQQPHWCETCGLNATPDSLMNDRGGSPRITGQAAAGPKTTLYSCTAK